MTQKFDFLTRTVESKTLMAWSVSLVGKQGVEKVVYMLGNSPSTVAEASAKYHQATFVTMARCPERDVETSDLATFFDKMDSHWNTSNSDGVAYPQKQWARGAGLAGEGFDYVEFSNRFAWSAGRFDGTDNLTPYERMGYHAHTQATMNGIIESGLPVMDFRLHSNLSKRGHTYGY